MNMPSWTEYVEIEILLFSGRSTYRVQLLHTLRWIELYLAFDCCPNTVTPDQFEIVSLHLLHLVFSFSETE